MKIDQTRVNARYNALAKLSETKLRMELFAVASVAASADERVFSEGRDDRLAEFVGTVLMTSMDMGMPTKPTQDDVTALRLAALDLFDSTNGRRRLFDILMSSIDAYAQSVHDNAVAA